MTPITEERLVELGFVLREDADNVPCQWYEHPATGLELWDGGWKNGEWIVDQFDQGGMIPCGIFTIEAVKLILQVIAAITADNVAFQMREDEQT